MLVEDEFLRNRSHVFKDRSDAGKRLAAHLQDYRGTDALIVAIPSGGVPVAWEIHDSLEIGLDLIITRKVPIPWNTEAGFGAVNLDGDVILNEDLLRTLNLSDEIVDYQIKKTLKTISERERIFRKDKEFPPLKDRTLILVDDGLASGYTMRAAIDFVRKRSPYHVIIAVPTGSYATILRLMPSVDTIVCPNVREGYPFAVADAYRHWYDLTDSDVVDILEGRKKAESPTTEKQSHRDRK
ncbi:MAG: phosphoribosyltransferase [bacterium]